VLAPRPCGHPRRVRLESGDERLAQLFRFDDVVDDEVRGELVQVDVLPIFVL